MQHNSSKNNPKEQDQKAQLNHSIQIHQLQKSNQETRDSSDEIGRIQHSNDHEEGKKLEQQSHNPKSHEGFVSDEEIPDHFYDSDLASINEKDFLSDNQPPKDIIQQRKLLYKQKLLHVFKTIIRLGTQIDKPARYDRIKLRWKQVEQAQVKPRPLHVKKKKGKKEEAEENISKVEKTEDLNQNGKEEDKQAEEYQKQAEEYTYPHYFSTFYLMNSDLVQYNLGRQYLEVERLVTSMKRNQAAVFELEHLEVSKKSNIKRRVKVEVFVIWVQDWTTVIDVDCDGKFMKEIIQKGQGHSRIAKHDEVAFEFTLKKGQQIVLSQKYVEPAKIQDDFLAEHPNSLWKMMHSMKSKEKVRVEIEDQVFRQVQADKYQKLSAVLEDKDSQQTKTQESNGDAKQIKEAAKWQLSIQVFSFHSIDDVFLDGRLLKKTLVRGVSTAKPDSSSLVYYALRFYAASGLVLFEDSCFNSDWWQDFQKLQLLHCRKNYLDDESVSQMLKQVIKRMKPAQIADIECRDRELFAYGSDYQQYRRLTKNQTIPQTVKLGIRVYNFTEGRNCFNMEIQQKVYEAKRKKAIAVRYLERGQVARALKTFENIVAFFSSGKINQQAYDEKISALMNCTLCHLKLQNYLEMVKLCDQILELPRHGYDPNKLKIKGPGQAKIEGKLPDEPGSEDEREEAKLQQNPKIIDKCCYRKALGLVRMGEGQKALDYLQRISLKSQEVLALEKEAIKAKEKYQKKSAKMYKNMFG